MDTLNIIIGVLALFVGWMFNFFSAWLQKKDSNRADKEEQDKDVNSSISLAVLKAQQDILRVAKNDAELYVATCIKFAISEAHRAFISDANQSAEKMITDKMFHYTSEQSKTDMMLNKLNETVQSINLVYLSETQSLSNRCDNHEKRIDDLVEKVDGLIITLIKEK